MMEYKLDLILRRVAVGLVVLLVIVACTIRLRDDACETGSPAPIDRDFDLPAPRLGPSHTATQEENDALLRCGEGRTAPRSPSLGERTARSTLSDRDGCQAPALDVSLSDDSRPTPNSFAIPAPEGK
jgi:hypothetical protein